MGTALYTVLFSTLSLEREKWRTPVLLASPGCSLGPLITSQSHPVCAVCTCEGQLVEEAGLRCCPQTPVSGPGMQDSAVVSLQGSWLGSLTWFLSDASLRDLQEGLMSVEGGSRWPGQSCRMAWVALKGC